MAKISSEKLADKTVKQILEKVGLKADVKVTEKDDNISVEVGGDNLGALIGFHGETLESLQLICSLIINRQNKETDWKRVSVDIGNWRKERSEVLGTMVDNAIKELEDKNLERLTLPNMSPSQRREIHVLVSEHYSDYQTESEGLEPNRRVVLFKKP